MKICHLARLVLATLWLLAIPALAQQPLTRLENCSYVPTDWADGDSFLVRTADGKEFTVRLYGADCIEWHISDDTDARRLREQRRYFGISKLGGDVAVSIEAAKKYGKSAAERVAVLLQKSFAIYTAYADARGDGKHQRVYGFVRLADGRDLASVLVEEGLARAFGVFRATPDGESSAEYREAMHDLELQAAKRGRGIWSDTDWETLPVERRLQRHEEADLNLAADKSEASNNLVLDPNTAARDELLKLPGVGEIMANRIIEGRPYLKVDDLLEVPGIGIPTLERLRSHLQIREPPK